MAPFPEILPFLGIQEKYLPFASKLRPAKCEEKFMDMTDDERKLINDLTGVKIALDCVEATPSMKPGVIEGMNKRREELRKPGSTQPCSKKMNCERNAPVQVQRTPKFEKAVDTSDLMFWTCTTLPEKYKNEETYSDTEGDCQLADSRASRPNLLDKSSTNLVDKVNDRSANEAFKVRIKEALGFINMRAQMLQDLSFGDAIRESAPVPLETQNKQQSDTGFRSASSVVIKHARRLAGLIHTEEQTLGLRDLFQCLQSIGKMLGGDLEAISKANSLYNECQSFKIGMEPNDSLIEDSHTVEEHPSKFEALHQVELDIRDHLANLYHGKNFLLSHQVELLSGMKVASSQEDAYETLGAAILDRLKEAETMEEEFQKVQDALHASGCPILITSHKKKSIKAHKGKKKAGQADNESHNSDTLQSERSSAISSSRIPPSEDQGGEPNDDSNKELVVAQNSSSNPFINDADSKSKPSLKRDAEPDSQKKNKQKAKYMSVKPTRDEKKDETITSSEVNQPSSGPVSQSGPVSAEKQAAINPINIKAVMGSLHESKLVSLKEMGSMEEERQNGANNLKFVRQIDKTSVTSSPNIEVRSPPACTSSSMLYNDGINLSSSSSMGCLLGDLEPSLTGEDVHTNMLKVKEGHHVRQDMVADNKEDAQLFDVIPAQVIGKVKRKSGKSSSSRNKDETIQTDDVVIISLDSRCDLMCKYNSDSMSAQNLFNEIQKLQKQLQFWRTKNWVEKQYCAHSQQKLLQAPAHNVFTVDAGPDMGMVFYYNPRIGFHTMKRLSELDASMQEFFLGLATEAFHSSSSTTSTARNSSRPDNNQAQLPLSPLQLPQPQLPPP